MSASEIWARNSSGNSGPNDRVSLGIPGEMNAMRTFWMTSGASVRMLARASRIFQPPHIRAFSSAVGAQEATNSSGISGGSPSTQVGSPSGLRGGV